MSESAEELYSKRGKVILGPSSGTVGSGGVVNEVNGTRVPSVVEAGKSYIITFNSDDPEWANMSLLINPVFNRTPLQQLNSTTYIVKFTATGRERTIGINNSGPTSAKPLSYTNYTLYEYLPVISGNVLRPFMADKMYYRNQEVQKLYLGSRLLWEREGGLEEWSSNLSFALIPFTSYFDTTNPIPTYITPINIEEITINGELILKGEHIASVSGSRINLKSTLRDVSLGGQRYDAGSEVTIHYTT